MAHDPSIPYLYETFVGQIVDPKPPATNRRTLFLRPDGNFYTIDSSGVVRPFGTGGSATVEIGQTITGSPGTDAAVTKDAAGKLVFTIPQGATGLTGATGPTGPAGADGTSAGLKYTYSTTTTAADPGAGFLRLNNATISSVTALYISETDGDANAIGAFLATWDDSTNTIKGTITIRSVADPTVFAVFNATALVDNGAWDTITITHLTSGGTWTNAMAVTVEFARAGDVGATGATGPAGADGMLPAITTYSGISTGSIADGATANISVTTMGKIAFPYRIEASHACWVRVYGTSAQRTADNTRTETDPIPDGNTVQSDVILPVSELDQPLFNTRFQNDDGPRVATYYLAVKNKSGGTATITLEFDAQVASS